MQQTIKLLKNNKIKLNGLTYKPYLICELPANFGCIEFKEREGHCRVPQRYKLDEFSLGAWVRAQRETKDSMSSERRQRLDDIGFVWYVGSGRT